MGDYGEFGPLDIQLTRDDEMSNTSGLSYLQSLTQLNEQIFRSFETNFINLKQKSSNTITTRTAAEIASKLAVGLISPISAQLDPVKLGEVHRAIKIADAYGKRLCTNNEKNLSKLIVGYPSHGFVIDFEEAQQLFKNVEYANDDDVFLELILFNVVRREGRLNIIKDLTSEITTADAVDANAAEAAVEPPAEPVAGEDTPNQAEEGNIGQNNDNPGLHLPKVGVALRGRHGNFTAKGKSIKPIFENINSQQNGSSKNQKS